jgi:hypothetical protein
MMSWADMCSDSGAETSGETPARVGERHLPSDTDEASPHADSPSHPSCESQNQGYRLTQVREIFDQAQRLLQAVCSAVDRPGAVPGGGIAAVRDQAELLLILDSVRLVEMTAKDRALWSCIRGRALDVVSSTHNPEAERELSRAVKLDPELGEAWNQLGTSAWKRGDEQFAHDCWQCTLRYCNALDGRADAVKVAMRELSMAFRVKGENPDESLRLAKNLVSRFVSDSPPALAWPSWKAMRGGRPVCTGASSMSADACNVCCVQGHVRREIVAESRQCIHGDFFYLRL